MKKIKVKSLSFVSVFKIFMMPLSVLYIFFSLFFLFDVLGNNFYISLNRTHSMVMMFTFQLPFVQMIFAIISAAFLKLGFWVYGKFGKITIVYDGFISSEVSKISSIKYMKIKTLSFLSLFKMMTISLILPSIIFLFICLLGEFEEINGKPKYLKIIEGSFVFVFLLPFFISFLGSIVIKLGFWIYGKGGEPITIVYDDGISIVEGQQV